MTSLARVPRLPPCTSLNAGSGDTRSSDWHFWFLMLRRTSRAD